MYGSNANSLHIHQVHIEELLSDQSCKLIIKKKENGARTPAHEIYT